MNQKQLSNIFHVNRYVNLMVENINEIMISANVNVKNQ